MHQRYSNRVKVARTCTLCVAVFISLGWPLFFENSKDSSTKDINKYYITTLKKFKSDLVYFNQLAGKKTNPLLLQNSFRQVRLSYKRLAVLTEYFSPYETSLMNAPALERVEDDVPDKIIAPSGLQAIGQILFTPAKNFDYRKVEQLASDLLQVVDRLETEPGADAKFSPELVWDAVRLSVLNVMLNGINGFDSPELTFSLTEAKASLLSAKQLLSYLINDQKKNPAVISWMQFDKAAKYIDTHNNFIGFDRLVFLRDYLDPLYRSIVKLRKEKGIGIPQGRNPMNLDVVSVFEKNAFNINFFSPGEEYWITPARIELGKKLFFDPVLSDKNSRSCASCHQPGKTFTDGLPRPMAMDNKTFLKRNTPTLWNSSLQTNLFWDSRTDILENQLNEVVHNESEMKGSLKKTAEELQSSKEYKKLFKEAYAGEKDPVTPYTIANAISSYQRSLISLNSRFDRYMRGETKSLSLAEKNGFNLFTGKARCATCHFVPLFNGLLPPGFTETESEVLGVPKNNDKKSPQLDEDLGKFLATGSPVHKFAFKTPTLRNIALTAPYMHNGVFSTLEEVIDFYDKGGGQGLKIAPPNQTLPPDKLNLSKKEKSDIIAFLESLTDTSGLR